MFDTCINIVTCQSTPHFRERVNFFGFDTCFFYVSTHVSHIFHLAINTRETTIKSCVNVDKSIDTIILLSNAVSTINQITCQIKLCQSTCQILLSEASILPPGTLLLYHCLHLSYTYRKTHDIVFHDTLLLLLLAT